MQFLNNSCNYLTNQAGVTSVVILFNRISSSTLDLFVHLHLTLRLIYNDLLVLKYGYSMEIRYLTICCFMKTFAIQVIRMIFKKVKNMNQS
jgi:hypothetical protein